MATYSSELRQSDCSLPFFTHENALLTIRNGLRPKLIPDVLRLLTHEIKQA